MLAFDEDEIFIIKIIYHALLFDANESKATE